MLFGKKKNEDKELKKKIRGLMDQYDRRDIDGPTYIQKMLELNEETQRKRRR